MRLDWKQLTHLSLFLSLFRSKSETGDDTGDVSPVEDHRRKRSGRTKKRSSQGGEKNDSSVWVSEFGEKMLLFHPAFDVDVREMSEKVRTTSR